MTRMSPLRGFIVPLAYLQGLTPLARRCRPFGAEDTTVTVELGTPRNDKSAPLCQCPTVISAAASWAVPRRMRGINGSMARSSAAPKP